jgi:hypothetical protein
MRHVDLFEYTRGSVTEYYPLDFVSIEEYSIQGKGLAVQARWFPTSSDGPKGGATPDSHKGHAGKRRPQSTEKTRDTGKETWRLSG